MADNTKSNKANVNKSAPKKTTTKSEYKPDNTRRYVFVSAVFNLIFGVLGLGIGFLFFLAMALTTGATMYTVVIFLFAAIAIALYLFCIYKINKGWVYVCSDKKHKEIDRNRLVYSMAYAVIILAIAFAYSFLKSAI